MKLNCGLTWEEKHEAKKQWHRFYCLWPRRVGSRDCRWLEYVERKRTFILNHIIMESYWKYEYRAI